MATKTLALEIITVGTPVYTKTQRGGYNSLEIAYKNHSFEGKVEGKKLVDFNDKGVFEFIKGLKQGDHVSITAEKGDNDQYWKWTRAELSDGTASAAAAVSSTPASGDSSSASKSVGRVTGSNYETPEERARRQVYIVRQSSISSALEYLKIATEPKELCDLSYEDVLAVARHFEKYVFGE